MTTPSSRRLMQTSLLALAPVTLVWLALTRAQPTQAAGNVSDCTMQGLAAAMSSGSGDISFSCGPATIPITVPFGLSVKLGRFYKIDGGNQITLTGLGANRLFNVQTGCALTLTNIILTDGSADNVNNTYFPGQGGALLNLGRLVLDHVTVRDSHSTIYGGGIDNESGTTLVTDSNLTRNQAHLGGAIANTGGTLRLLRTTLFGNMAQGGEGGGLWVIGDAFVSDSFIFTNFALDGGYGGGIFNEGTLSVTNSTVVGNAAGWGGGIQNKVGTTTLLSVSLSANTAITGGGGLMNLQGVATLTDSFLVDNQTNNNLNGNGWGGGLYNLGGTATLNHMALQTNQADYGGGIYNGGTVTLNNSTIISNTAARSSGGIVNDGGTVTLNNSTLSGNRALSSSGSGGGISNGGTVTLNNSTLSGNSAVYGGGIINFATITLNNSTLSGNSAANNGGGIFHDGSNASATFTVKNTIIANSPSGGNCFKASSSVTTITSGGYNLSSDDKCALFLTQLSDLPPNTDPNLGPLANHGGPTQTHMPLTPDSPGIDRIPKFTNGCGTTLTSDQRGAPRPINNMCDIGAVEYGATFPWLYLPLVVR